MKQMGRRERLQAAINREPVDRIPYAVWRHFPSVDRSPAGLAQATLRFHERYGSDFIKITPRGGYAVEAWGCVEADEQRPDGHRPCARCAVRDASDWKKIRALDPAQALAEGLSGIFYSIQAASRSVSSEDDYGRFGEPYDRRVLESVMGKSMLTIVHCHGDRLMFDRLAALPGNAWNWDDRAAGPSL